MPSEHSPASNASPARTGSAEKGQRLPTTGGVRGLLGLPMRERGVVTTTSLTAAPRGPHYGQSPMPASEENDESFREVARDEEVSEERGGASANPQNDLPQALPRAGASLPNTRAENPADTRPAPTEILTGRREHASLVIPGVSTHRTQFAALSHVSDMAKAAQQEEPQRPSSDQAAPLHTPTPPSHPREREMFEVERLSRLERLVTEGAKAQPSPETPRAAMTARPPSPVEQIGVVREERGASDMARRLTQLQHTVNDLAATVAAQAARLRDQSQAQEHERKTLLQRMSVFRRGDASPTAPRAFWERSRLGRLHLRVGR